MTCATACCEASSPGISITDHALLRFMERAYGVDVEAWRSAMRVEVVDALTQYDGHSVSAGPAFVIGEAGQVITYISAGMGCPYRTRDGAAVRRIVR